MISRGVILNQLLLLNKACFLDPRFKSLSFLSEQEKEVVFFDIEKEAQDLRQLEDQAKASETEISTDTTEPRSPKRLKKSFVSLLLEDVATGDSVIAQSEDPQERGQQVHSY